MAREATAAMLGHSRLAILITGKKRKVGGIRCEARSCGRSSPKLLGFLSQMIEPTAWAAVSSLSTSTRYRFLKLSGLGRALWANSGKGSAQ